MCMITVLGRVAAVVAFFIGGIGILSIMILIVNERRVEIGIRRAVGSRKRDIILQFLIESAFISLSGGTVGLIASFITTIIIFMLSDLPFTVSPTDARKDNMSPVRETVKRRSESIKRIIFVIKLAIRPTVPPLKDMKADSIRN